MTQVAQETDPVIVDAIGMIAPVLEDQGATVASWDWRMIQAIELIADTYELTGPQRCLGKYAALAKVEEALQQQVGLTVDDSGNIDQKAAAVNLAAWINCTNRALPERYKRYMRGVGLVDPDA